MKSEVFFLLCLFQLAIARVCLENEYYILFEGKCYGYYDFRLNHDEAQAHCIEDGAKLVEPLNDWENEWIANTSYPETVWIGVNDKEQENTFVYDSTGLSIIYDNWGEGQPDNARGGEDCVIMNFVEQFENSEWNDIPCNGSHKFVCQLPCDGDCAVCESLTTYNITPSEVTLDWTRPCTNWTVLNYHIDFEVITEPGHYEYSQDYECVLETCPNNQISGLRSCLQYEVQLRAIENGGNSDVVYYDRPMFETLPAIPTNVNNLMAIDVQNTSITLQWNHPSLHKECTQTYHICHQLVNQRNVQICEESDPVQNFTVPFEYTLDDLEPCAIYFITVQPNSVLGLGPSAPIEVEMLTADPGPPEDFQVLPLNSTCLTLDWDIPTNNSYCLVGYSVTCRKDQKESPAKPTAAFNEIYCGLEPCTEYECEIVSVGVSGAEDSLASSDSNTTLIDVENPPSPPNSLDISYVTENSLYMTWSRPDSGYNCMDGYEISYTNLDVTDFDVIPVDIGAFSYTLTDLLPCSNYRVEVYGTTPFDIEGGRAVDNARTLDIAPGTPVNLGPTSIRCDNLTFCWDLPFVNPQCAVNYETDFKPLVTSDTFDRLGFNAKQEEETCLTYSNLSPDTEYLFEVWLIAADEQRGPSAITTARTLPICI